MSKAPKKPSKRKAENSLKQRAKATKPATTGSWKKGQSGNPGGRPREIGYLRELARERTEEAIETLADVMLNGESDSARVAAATALLDRGYGRAQQAVEVSGPDGAPLQAVAAAVVVLPAEQIPGALQVPRAVAEAQPLQQLEQPKAEG